MKPAHHSAPTALATASRRWDLALFHVGGDRRSGWAWESWGVYRAGRRRYVTVHLPSATRLPEFGSLATARRWCEAIDNLVDWSRLGAADLATHDLAMHRIALRVTGRRPELQVVSP